MLLRSLVRSHGTPAFFSKSLLSTSVGNSESIRASHCVSLWLALSSRTLREVRGFCCFGGAVTSFILLLPHGFGPVGACTVWPRSGPVGAVTSKVSTGDHQLYFRPDFILSIVSLEWRTRPVFDSPTDSMTSAESCSSVLGGR